MSRFSIRNSDSAILHYISTNLRRSPLHKCKLLTQGIPVVLGVTMSNSEEVYKSGTLWWHLLVKIPMHAGEAAPSPTSLLIYLKSSHKTIYQVAKPKDLHDHSLTDPQWSKMRECLHEQSLKFRYQSSQNVSQILSNPLPAATTETCVAICVLGITVRHIRLGCKLSPLSRHQQTTGIPAGSG